MPKFIPKTRKILCGCPQKPSILPLLTPFSYRKISNSSVRASHPNFPHRRRSPAPPASEIIERASQNLATSLNLTEIYDVLANTVFDLLPAADMVHLYRVNPRSGLLNCIYGSQRTCLYKKVFDPATLEPATGVLQRQVMHTQSPVLVTDLARFMQAIGRVSSLARRGPVHPPTGLTGVHVAPHLFIPRSAVDVPMLAGGELIGILEALSARRNRFNEQDMHLLGLAANTAAVVLQSYHLRQQAEDYTRDLQNTYSATVDSWRRALELRDQATEGHGMRVAEIAVQLAVQLGVDPSQLTNIRFGAQLHDIGKIGVPDNILLKPGPLDEKDFEVMKKHPVYAYEMLVSIPVFNQVLDIPYYHHERWDGSGYPHGLAGDQIPLPARIFAVVDVWDALRSDRPYRPAWPEPQVRNYIQEQSGKHFDPQVVDAFMRLLMRANAVQSVQNQANA